MSVRLKDDSGAYALKLEDGGIEASRLSLPTDPTSPPARLVMVETANTTGSRPNSVVWLGHNISDSGGRIDSSKHAIALTLEGYWINGSGDPWTEAHLQIVTPAGNLYRPWTCQSDIAAGDPGHGSDERIRLFFNNDDIAFSSRDGTTQWFNMTVSGIIYPDNGAGFTHSFYRNGFAPLQQANAAVTAFVPLIGLNAQDRVELGDSSHGVLAYGLRVRESAGSSPATSNLLRAVATGGTGGGGGFANGDQFGLSFHVDIGSEVPLAAVNAVYEDTGTGLGGLSLTARNSGGGFTEGIRVRSTGVTLNGSLALTGATTGTTVGAAGAASAMPTPLGYVTVSLNGANVNLAYFNT